MPVKLTDKGYISNFLDFEKEIKEPKSKGYYLEVVARLDAYLDSLLDSLLRQVYSNSDCQSLLNSIEKAMKKDYVFVSGLVRLDALNATKKYSLPDFEFKLPSKEMDLKIRKFKTNRNKILHNELGWHSLVKELPKSNEKYQYQARQKVIDTIDKGIECYNELRELLQTNAIIIQNKK